MEVSHRLPPKLADLCYRLITFRRYAHALSADQLATQARVSFNLPLVVMPHVAEAGPFPFLLYATNVHCFFDGYRLPSPTPSSEASPAVLCPMITHTLDSP